MLLMEHRPQLPPITTHFAEFFPRHSTHAALVTPPEDSSSPNRPLKRKRSDLGLVEGPYQRPFNPAPAIKPPEVPSYRFESTEEPDRKRFASYYAGDQPQRHVGAEARHTCQTYDALTSPRRYSVPDAREAKPSDFRGDGHSHSQPQRPDWASNVRETGGQDKRGPPPLSRSRSPLGNTADDRRRNSLRGGPDLYPSPMEPKSLYYQMPSEDKAGTIVGAQTTMSDPGRIPPFGIMSASGSGSQNQALESRDSPPSTRRFSLNTTLKSPGLISPHTRGLGLSHSTPSQPSTRDNRIPHVGYSNPASDTSPVSARLPPESPQRYTWDAPGLYEHSHRKRRGNLPKESTALLTDWFNKHASYPYPKEAEKQALQQQTGLAMSQISNWFVNARRRRRPSISLRTDHIHQAQAPPSRDREPLHPARYR